ncbi:hypothetical protein Tco_0710396 [Tanacetum coccineum]
MVLTTGSTRPTTSLSSTRHHNTTTSTTGAPTPPPLIAIIISSGRVFVSLGLHSNKGAYGFVISTKEGALGLKPPQHHLGRGQPGCQAKLGTAGVFAWFGCRKQLGCSFGLWVDSRGATKGVWVCLVIKQKGVSGLAVGTAGRVVGSLRRGWFVVTAGYKPGEGALESGRQPGGWAVGLGLAARGV